MSTVEDIYRRMTWRGTYGRLHMNDWIHGIRPGIPVYDGSSAPYSNRATRPVLAAKLHHDHATGSGDIQNTGYFRDRTRSSE